MREIDAGGKCCSEKEQERGERERMDRLKPKPPSPPCKYHLLASLGKDKEERANNRPANYRSYTSSQL